MSEEKSTNLNHEFVCCDESGNDNNDKLNDIVITQCIICLAIAVGILLLNIFCPDVSRELIDKYKDYSENSDKEAVCDFVNKAVQAFSNLS